MTNDELMKQRRLIVTTFAVEAGKLMGFTAANYGVLKSELPIDDLLLALDKIRSHSHSHH